MSIETSSALKSEVRENMRIIWDALIPMDDGLELRANVFLPLEDGPFPVLITMGPYGKDLPFQVGYAPMWEINRKDFPSILENTSNEHQVWECVDPEKWTRDGYALVRVDARGAGRSPGVMNCLSERETQDFHDSIEWAAAQPWSTGKVGISGTSYHAINAWQVATRINPPPHLAAICAWEGATDWYREAAYHGGIPSVFLGKWFADQVEGVQYGTGTTSHRNEVSGLHVGGDETLPDEVRRGNRHDIAQELLDHPLDGPYWRERSPAIERLQIPFLSAGNWGSHGLHLRGNIDAFVRAPTSQKWLEMHGREHWPLFYDDYGRELQKRFFDYFLKGEGDWERTQPRLQLQIRNHDGTFTRRDETSWPLENTSWTKAFLQPDRLALDIQSPSTHSSASYLPLEDGLTLRMPVLTEPLELTGPVACRLFVSSETTDADIFLVLRAFDPEGREVLFRAMTDPQAPIAQGWLRASHRAVDEERSEPWLPFHPHDHVEPLTPGEVYQLDIEIWPTCVTLPAGYQLALSVLGQDFDHGLPSTETRMGVELRGSSTLLHTERDAEVYGGEVTVHSGPGQESFLLLPMIER